MTKIIWMGRFFIFIGVAKLFCTTAKSGSRSYHIFRIGFDSHKINDKRIIALMIDVPFIEVGIGKLLK